MLCLAIDSGRSLKPRGEDKGETGEKGAVVAIAPFLAGFPEIRTLGVRPSIGDYTQWERRWIRDARLILFPTLRFALIFEAAGKRCFPGSLTYRYRRSRILQQLFVQYHGLPAARSRIYFGRQRLRIAADFPPPCELAGPDRAIHPVRRVGAAEAFPSWRTLPNPVVARESLSFDRRVRLLLVHGRCRGILESEEKSSVGSFWTPVDRPPEAVAELVFRSEQLAGASAIDDIVFEWGRTPERWVFTDMIRPPKQWPLPLGRLHRHRLIGDLVRQNHLFAGL
jgi:hypothetical protein